MPDKPLKKLTSAFAAAAATGIAAWVTYQSAIRPWMVRWGATAEELARPLPGDDLLPNPKILATHAITIHAPTSAVWPWIAQLGQGRGGFYSYEFIENAIGADIHNTDRILPEYQNPQVGDKVPLAKGGFGVPIAIVQPGKALVLHGDSRIDQDESLPKLKPGDYMAVVWGFYLEERPDGTTRFIERWRGDYNDSLSNRLFNRLFLEPGAFFMERKMLLSIKERAERMAAS